jgi:hypothetical protein
MGHASVKSTGVYAKILDSELDKRWRFSTKRKVIERSQCYTYVVPAKKNALQVIYEQSVISIYRDPAGTRTQDPNIKSVVLYQLSYKIDLPF